MATSRPRSPAIATKVLVGDVWERPGLSKRDRSLITVASLAPYRANERPGHVKRARDNAREGLVELVTTSPPTTAVRSRTRRFRSCERRSQSPTQPDREQES